MIGERHVGDTSDDDVSSLVKRASDGDQAAWDALLDRYTRTSPRRSRCRSAVARLVQDTALAPVGSRSAGEPRMIAFAADEITVDVEVTGGPDDHRITGVVDGAITDLAVQTPAATYAVDVDAQGRFRVSRLEGPCCG